MQVLKNRVYRHFKGNYYLVVDLAINNEDDSEYVIYRALYGDGQLYVRPKHDFTGLTDTLKYPDATQKYKFELVNKIERN